MIIKKIFLPFLLLTVLSSCSVNKEIPSSKTNTNLKYQAVIDSIYLAHPDVKGILAHIESPKQKISWSGAAGYADYKNGIFLKSDQPALIASSIKTIVSATVLKLIEQKETTLETSIQNIISKKSSKLLMEDGYDLASIQIKHLLSHTSGIQDYINKNYIDTYLTNINNDKQHRWSRDEQIALTVLAGDPIDKPGVVYNYADANFLLLTEIIEFYTQKSFYAAIRALIDYEQLGLTHTWFHTLEDKPEGVNALAHQYWGEWNWDSYDIDPSFDLYGGGGIACTTKDLALFSYNLFNGNIIKDKEVVNLIFTKVPTVKNNNATYYMGLSESTINGFVSYGHGGFWGTIHQYIPELETAVVVYVLERDKKSLRKDILEGLVQKISKDTH